MKIYKFLLILLILFATTTTNAQLLKVKNNKTAIVKKEPTGNGEVILRLDAGSVAMKLGEVPRYYSIQLENGITGFSYKGNFIDTTGNFPVFHTKEYLMARTDVLKIIVVDVEVGDATLIICPEENGEQDILLIDTGEKGDAERIKEEIIRNGFNLAGQPISRFYVSHYDNDHMGDVAEVAYMVEVAYDLGENDMTSKYKKAMVNVDRRKIATTYHETFTGGVTIECVAANQATDFDPQNEPSKDKNTNSIALIVSYNGFDYFTGGDLTLKPEKSLAKGIKNCDAYHANHHGSKTTSSSLEFIQSLDPEITVVSNGTRHGHPSDVVAQRLIDNGSIFYQTNINPDERAYQAPVKYLGDTTYFKNSRDEKAEGAKGSIRLVVDTANYYVIMPNLSLAEGTFDIEK